MSDEAERGSRGVLGAVLSSLPNRMSDFARLLREEL